MKKNTIIILLLLISMHSKAQDYRKYWGNGNLTFGDFQAKPTKQSASYLAYVLMYKTDKKIVDNITYRGVFSSAYMDKSLSFIHHNLKDGYHLKYNQVIFNLVEIHKRKLQTRIYNLANVFEINSLLSDTKTQLDRKILEFQEEGNFGIHKETTDKWLQQTIAEIETTSSFEIPQLRRSNWSYGLYVGLDFGIYGKEYREFFNNTIAVSLGFEFSYKKVFMGLNMNFTNSKLNQNLIDDSLTILKGERATIGLLNISLGYPVYETEKFRILPFAGYGLNFISEAGKQEDKDEISKGASIFGVSFDFKNKKTVNFTPSIYNLKEEGNSYIRARIFMSNSSFNQNLKGYSINIGIAYGIEARFLQKK